VSAVSAPSPVEVPTAVQTKDEEYTIAIIPLHATRDTVLSLVTSGFDIKDADVTWLVNGTAVKSELPNQFKALGTKKGDLVQAKVIIHDREILSNAVQIKNAPPEITSLRIIPEALKSSSSLRVETEGKDIDGDAITYAYQWTKNDKPSGTGTRIEGPLKKGDQITVKVTPYDGESYGNPALLRTEIKNTPPIVVEDRQLTFDGRVYTRQIRASGAEGDTLIYSLQQAPEGMTIDASTGLITWQVAPKDSGSHSVIVQVSDGHGGEILYAFVTAIELKDSK
jgi:hypothetical protein